MKWAWRIARVADIDIRLHVTFLALLVWIAWGSYATTGTVAGALDGVLLICLVFGIVVLHELGHALTARRFGIRTRDITLLPIGGVASLERMPEDPRQELLVALAGPAVNFVLALLLGSVAYALGQDVLPATEAEAASPTMLVRLVWINVALGVFNLLPAFPMDGGRVLRALLALRLSHVRATRLAAGLGQALALLFGIVGLFVSPVLVFVALFVWMGASGESSMAEAKFLAHGVPVAVAMVREFEVVSPEQPIAVSVQRMLETFQHDFPVVEHDRVVGMLGREAMLRTLASAGPNVIVGEVMRRDVPQLHPNDDLDDALLQVMSEGETLPVVDAGGRLVGLLGRETLGEFLSIRQTLLERSEHGGAARAKPLRVLG